MQRDGREEHLRILRTTLAFVRRPNIKQTYSETNRQQNDNTKEQQQCVILFLHNKIVNCTWVHITIALYIPPSRLHCIGLVQCRDSENIRI